MSNSKVPFFAKCMSFVVVFFAASSVIVEVRAQEVQLKEKLGIWSLYCLAETAGQVRYRDCSITSGVLAKGNPDLWAKVAIAIANPSGGLEMTVRTPVLKYLRNGISLGFDGRQAVKGYVDTCSGSSCEGIISLDERLSALIGTSDKMSVEYQIADAKGVVLTFDLDQIVPVLHSLEKVVGMEPAAIASVDGGWKRRLAGRSEPMRFVLERRAYDLGTVSYAGTVAWKAPLKKCTDAPAIKVVFVNSDLSVQNEKAMQEWAEKSNKCSNEAAVWIKQENAGSDTSADFASTKLSSWTLYNSVSKFVPTGLVPADDSRVAVLPPIGPEAGPTLFHVDGPKETK